VGGDVILQLLAGVGALAIVYAWCLVAARMVRGMRANRKARRARDFHVRWARSLKESLDTTDAGE
jgi:hypothetical protein